MREVNLNTCVYMRLTEHGQEVLEQNLDKAMLPEHRKPEVKQQWAPDTQGWSCFRMWVLIQIFGANMNDKDPLFINNVIRIPDNNLKEV